MLSHHALAVLASPAVPATTCQRALAIFSAYDLSLPRQLSPRLLDERWEWPAGTASKLIATLVRLEVLRTLDSAGNARSWRRTGRTMRTDTVWVRLRSDMTWSPRALAEQWQAMERAAEREQFASSAAAAVAAAP